jgi:MSHA pilin protein MshA
MGMKLLKNESGFTMIELVVVIVILGILAAFAVPQFANLQTEAREAAVNGMAGAIRGAVSIARAKYLVVGDTAAVTVDMDGTAVDVIASTGRPTSAAVGGINVALQDTGGFTIAYGATATFTPTNGGSATCRVEYVAATGAVTAQTGDCS